MTRRRDVGSRGGPRAAAAGRLLRAGVHAGRQDLVAPPGEGHPGRARGEPAHDRRLGRASWSAQGKRVIYDAEHFFDGFRADPDYALRCLRAAAEAGAENVTLCDTNGSSRARAGDRGDRARGRGAGRLGPGRHPHARRRRLRRGQHARGGGGRSAPGAGHDERLRRALRQRQPGHDRPDARAEDGLRVHRRRPAAAPDRGRRTWSTSSATSRRTRTSPTSGANAFAHKGGMHVAGVNRDARTFEHVDPADVGADRRVLVSELSGKGTVTARADVDDATAARVIERVKELEHQGYQFEAADGSFDLLIRKETGDYEPLFRLESWRAIVEKRADGRVETEATIKIWVDGERYVRTAEGNGPVHALDKALREAIGERYPHLRDIQLVNFKVRILDERKGTARGHARAARRQRRHRQLGLDRRVGEHHRGELGGAGRLARGGHAARADRARRDFVAFVIPLAKPLVGPREEELVLETLRSGRLALGPRLGEFEAAPGGAARRGRSRRCRAAPPGFTSRSGRRASRRATRSSPRRSRSSPPPTACSTRTRSRCSATSTRARSTSTRPRPRRRSPSAPRGCCRCTSSATRPTCPRFERLAAERGLWLVEDACEALGASHADGTPVGARGNLSRLRLLPEQADHDGGGGRRRLPGRRRQGAHRLRAQPGPRARHGLARPRPARLQLPARRPLVRARRRAAGAPRRAARRARPRRGALLRGAGRRRGARSCPARTPAATGAPGSSTPCSCRRASTATPRWSRCASAAWTPSPTCPRST